MKLTVRNLALSTLAAMLVPTVGYLITAGVSAGPVHAELPALDRLAQMPEEASPEMEPGSGPGRFGRGGPEHLIEELNLSADQVEQIRTLRENARTASAPLREELRSAHATMRDLMASDAPTEQLRQQHAEVSRLNQQMRDQRFETMLAIRNVLTEAQRAELNQLMETRHSQRQERFENFRQRR